jgi:hypothetical protein
VFSSAIHTLLFCRFNYISFTEQFHQDDVKDVNDLPSITYSFKGWQSIKEGFDDKEMASSDHLDYFALCLMDDDKTLRKTETRSCQGFRIVLPVAFAVSDEFPRLFFMLNCLPFS